MALTRKSLKAMGLTDEQVDSIIEMHTETTDGLKEQIKGYKADAEKLASVQKELDDLKGAAPDEYKEKYETEKRNHDALKNKIAYDEAHGAKEKAVRAYYESKNIKGKNLAIAMRGTKVDDFELDGDKLKDTKAIDELIAGDYAALVVSDGKGGADSGNPAGNNGNDVDYDKMTDAEYYAAMLKKKG